MRLSYGCPGGGVGRCRTRFSGAESDSSTPPPLPTSPPAAISKRMDVPPTGERIALDPLVARVLAPNSSPYTYTGTQTHLVGPRDLAVIDPGPDDPAHPDALIRAIDGRPVTAIVVTHTPRDPTPLSPALKAEGRTRSGE